MNGNPRGGNSEPSSGPCRTPSARFAPIENPSDVTGSGDLMNASPLKVMVVVQKWKGQGHQ